MSRRHAVEMHGAAIALGLVICSWPWLWPLTLKVENIFSNVHLHDEYLWQVLLKSLYISRYMKWVITDGKRTDGRTDSRMAYSKT